MINATPRKPHEPREQTIEKIAEAFHENGQVKLGRYIVLREVRGWTTILHWKDTEDERGMVTEHSTDGIHHSAEQAFNDWTSNNPWFWE